MKEEEKKAIERHLYERVYRTVIGDWSKLHYGNFKCWDGVRREFALGSIGLQAARDVLGELRSLNRGRHDFGNCQDGKCPCFIYGRNKAKHQQITPPEKLTVAKRIPAFLKTKEGMPSHNFWNVCCGHIERHLGSLALDEVTRSKIAEYKAVRKQEPIFRHRKPVEKTKVSGSTVNREITALICLLNHAAEDGLLEKLPATRKLKDSEDDCARESVLDGDEYAALLEASPRWLERAIIGANECLSRVDLLKLTVDEVHRKKPETAMIKVAGGRGKTKAKQKIPISPALAEVLDELDRERKKLTSLQGPDLVFTRDGKPISKNALRKAFEGAKKAAGINDFRFHDLRHCAVTRWTLAGIPEELRKIAAGHKRGSVHQRYSNPPDAEMVRVFAEKLGWKKVDVVFTQQMRTADQSAK